MTSLAWPEGSANPGGPLNGVKILDLSRILAGPTTTSILSDLGADVIKVERPGSGDETRRWGPPFHPSGTAAYFYTCNRGKRSITLDMREADDLALALSLLAQADVLIENFLPGALDRMGLDRATIRATNSRIVHATISGYGNTSSKSSWPALDFVVQAHAGVLGVTGPDPSTPVKAGVPIADLSAGLYAAIGILAALRRAESDGTGSHIEVALADSCISLLANQAMNVLIGDADPAPAGNTHPSVAPYETLMAADRLVAVAATSEVQFQRMCAVLGTPELADDARFATNSERMAHRAELAELLAGNMASRPAVDWVRELNEAGVAAAVVNSPREALLDDPDIHERMVAGDQLRTPIRIDGSPLELSAEPPALGAANDQVRWTASPSIGSSLRELPGRQ